MKRSTTIHLVLSGALTGVALTGCSPSDGERSTDGRPLVSESESYTNNHHVHGVGYYHAPYHAWYPYPYNHYRPDLGYYHGGNWSSTAHESGVTSSSPTSSAVSRAVGRSSFSSGSSSGFSSSRGGFGHSSSSGGT